MKTNSESADSVRKSHAHKSIYLALSANIAIAVAKMTAAALTLSSAMMAESIHSLADSANQLLLLVGIKRSRRPPSEDHPLGYGKALYFWSFLVALIMFSVGGAYSFYEGLQKFLHPEPMYHPAVAIIVLIFSIAAEGTSFLGCMREINRDRRGKSLAAWFRETRKSDLLVVYGEDMAALIGLGLALAAVVLTLVTGNPVFDALGSMVIGLLLMLVAIFVGIEIKALLIGQGVEPDKGKEMKDFLEQQPEITEIYNLITLQLGSDIMVAVKARMTDCSSPQELIEAINRCENAFRETYPRVLWLFFEPDIRD